MILLYVMGVLWGKRSEASGKYASLFACVRSSPVVGFPNFKQTFLRLLFIGFFVVFKTANCDYFLDFCFP